MLILDLNNKVIPDAVRINRRRHEIFAYELSGGIVDGVDITAQKFAEVLGVSDEVFEQERGIVRAKFPHLFAPCGSGESFRSPNQSRYLEPEDSL